MICRRPNMTRFLSMIAAVLWMLLGIPLAAAPKLDRLPDINGKLRHQALLEKAQMNGKVRVLIGLTLDEGRWTGSELPAGPTKGQPASIKDAQEKLLSKFASHRGARATKRFTTIPYLALEVTPWELEALSADPDVTVIEEDIMVSPTLQNSVPQVGANNVWSSGYTGAGQVIAILDTGIDKSHSFLTGKVISEACYSSNLCPNGQPSQIGPGAGVNCPTNIPQCNHGTHVAGIAAGRGSSFSGMAKDANLISIQVFSNTNSSLGASSSDIILGLERVYQLRDSYSIAAVNLSLGGGTYPAPCDNTSRAMTLAISNLSSKGIATVISSGNNAAANGISWPGCITQAISVGSVTKSDVVSSFSNSASFLSLLAPGENIYSSLPGTAFGYMSGTSMAAPHVAGAWALLKSKWPVASVKAALDSLQGTGKPITDSRNGSIKPRIQVDQAMQNLSNWMLMDSDGDGIINKDELAAGRNPYVNEITVVTIVNSILLDD